MKLQPKIFWNKDVLNVMNFSDFLSFQEKAKATTETPVELSHVRRLVVSSSSINDFGFLEFFPSLKQLGFLACNSDNWLDLTGTANIISLRLHNLKQGKQYLPSVAFVKTFTNLQYLYVNMLGLSHFSELENLKFLHTIFAVCRNENARKMPFDLSALEFLPGLKEFNTWCAVDRHRIPAESIIPVLKNPSLISVSVIQMYAVEDRKLQKLIEAINPNLLHSSRTDDERHNINLHNFAW